MALSSISSALTCRFCSSKESNFYNKGGHQESVLFCKFDDKLPKHACSKCINRVKTLEKATADLSSFKRSARSVMEHHAGCLKRTKETTSDVGVSPDRGLGVKWLEDSSIVNKTQLIL